MKYIDSGRREAEQTVAFWMEKALSSGISAFRCQAGYFTLEGSSLLLPLLKQCATEGSLVRLLLGSNGGATLASHIAFLAGTLGVPQKHVSLGVVSFDTSLFHPKVYHFTRRNGSQTAYIGSANLTGPGISGLNIEAGIILDTDDGDDAGILNEIVGGIESWFDGGLPGLSPIATAKDVDDLLASGHLSLRPILRAREPGEEGAGPSETQPHARARLQPIFRLPVVEHEATEPAMRRKRRPLLPEPDLAILVRNTEASFHYPQGTHLGHILSILWHFSRDRTGTPFDDQFIRLNGSLGAGRIAAYRRQVKYKMLAAIELGLISDIRLVESLGTYIPSLTDDGRELWRLLREFIDPNDLVLEADADGTYSSSMPHSASYYNTIMNTAQSRSAEVRELFRSIFLNMPAVLQMMKFLYHQERTQIVQKARIYENFFQSQPVQNFCDAMGIEPATLEAARRRCPYLLNILDSCEILSQTQHDVTVNRLALAPELLVPEGADLAVGERILPVVIAEWGSGVSTLPESVQQNLKNLFGNTFLTDRYHLNIALEIPR